MSRKAYLMSINIKIHIGFYILRFHICNKLIQQSIKFKKLLDKMDLRFWFKAGWGTYLGLRATFAGWDKVKRLFSGSDSSNFELKTKKKGHHLGACLKIALFPPISTIDYKKKMSTPQNIACRLFFSQNCVFNLCVYLLNFWKLLRATCSPRAAGSPSLI